MTMATVPQNAIRDIEKYVGTVLDGLDMFPAFGELNSYIFQGRDLKAVVLAACQEPENFSQITCHLSRILNFLCRECETIVDKFTPNGISDSLFKGLNLRLNIAYEVAKALTVEVKLCDDSISELLDSLKGMLKNAYEISKESNHWKTQNQTLFEFFMDTRLECIEPASSLDEPRMFARSDGVVSSIAFEKAEQATAKKNNFSAKIKKIVYSFISKNPDDKAMLEILKTCTNFSLDGAEADQICNEFLRVWDIVLDEFDLYRKSQILFISVLKKFFIVLPNQKKNDFANKLYDSYNKYGNILPNIEKYVENYQQGLNDAINQIPIDHQRVNAEPEKFQQIQDELLWYLFAAPVSTFHQLLAACVRTKGIVPSVVKICRLIPSLFSRRFVITEPNNQEIMPDYLIIVTLRKLLHVGKKIWKTSEEFDNLAYVAVSFARSRKNGTEDSETPLLSSYDLISFASSQLFDGPPISIEIMMKILHRILANNNNNRMLANYRFSVSFNQELEPNMIAAPHLLHLMHELLLVHDGVNSNVAEYCRETMKSIGVRLKESNQKFDAETIRFLTEKCFNRSGWWVKYAIFSWFDTAFDNARRQVPSGIYIALDESEKDKFEQIKTSDRSSAAECYLRSFFELGFFDVDLAIELLNKGYEAQLNDVDVIEKMALALVDSYGKRFAKRQGGKEISRLLKEMITIFDPTRSFHKLENWSAWIFEAVKSIDYLMVLSKAAKMAVSKKLSAPFKDLTGTTERAFDELIDYGTVADQLLDIYCESVKELMDYELGELIKLQAETRRVLFESPDEFHEGWRLKGKLERREQKLIHQMTILFSDSVAFTRILKQVPIKFKNMLVGIVNQISTLQLSSTNRALDDVVTDTLQKDMVYAFANAIPEREKNQESATAPSTSNEAQQPQHVDVNEAVLARPTIISEDDQKYQQKTSAANPMFQNNSCPPRQFLHSQQLQQHTQSNNKQSSYNQRGSNSSYAGSNEDRRRYGRVEANGNFASRGNTLSENQRDPSNSRYSRRENSGQRDVLHDPHTLSARDRHTFNQNALQKRVRCDIRPVQGSSRQTRSVNEGWTNDKTRKNSIGRNDNEWRQNSSDDSDGFRYENAKQTISHNFGKYVSHRDEVDRYFVPQMGNTERRRCNTRNSGGSRSESERSSFNDTHKTSKMLDRNGAIPQILKDMEHMTVYGPTKSSSRGGGRGGRGGRNHN